MDDRHLHQGADLESQLSALHRLLAEPGSEKELEIELQNLTTAGELPQDIEDLWLPWRRLRRAAGWQERRRRRELRADRWHRLPRVQRLADFFLLRPLGQALGSFAALLAIVGMFASLLLVFPRLEMGTQWLAIVLAVSVALSLGLLASRLLEGQARGVRVPLFLRAQRLASVMLPIVGVGLLLSQWARVETTTSLAGSMATETLAARMELQELRHQYRIHQYKETIRRLQRPTALADPSADPESSVPSPLQLASAAGFEVEDRSRALQLLENALLTYRRVEAGEYVGAEALLREREKASLQRALWQQQVSELERRYSAATMQAELAEQQLAEMEATALAAQGKLPRSHDHGGSMSSLQGWRAMADGSARWQGLEQPLQHHRTLGLFASLQPTPGDLSYPGLTGQDGSPNLEIGSPFMPTPWSGGAGGPKAEAVDGFLQSLGAQGRFTTCLRQAMRLIPTAGADGEAELSLPGYLTLEGLYFLAGAPTDRAAPFESPDLKVQAPAVYPEQALRLQKSGSVDVRVCVDEAGRPVSVLQASEPLGFGLDEAAKAAALSSRWRPARLGQFTTPAWASLRVEFKPGG